MDTEKSEPFESSYYHFSSSSSSSSSNPVPSTWSIGHQ
jgi:hypothetical protein